MNRGGFLVAPIAIGEGMLKDLYLNGKVYKVNPAAVSCIKYRSEYGESFINALANQKSANELQGILLKFCHAALIESGISVQQFASMARKEETFFQQAQLIRKAAMAGLNSKVNSDDNVSSGEFDEYEILALAAAAGVDISLTNELTIMQFLDVVKRTIDAKNPHKSKKWVKIDPKQATKNLLGGRTIRKVQNGTSVNQ
jgi:hypothetical protein